MLVRVIVLGAFLLFGAIAGAWAEQGTVASPPSPSPVTISTGRLSASDLMELCVGKYDIDLGFCAGYMSAVADIMLDQPLYGFRTCLPSTVKSQQIMDNVVLRMKAMPAREPFAARAVVADAIARSFPCF